MGIIKKNLLKVIEWTDSSLGTMVYKFDYKKDRYEIMKGSKLVVNESQAAIFVQEGQIADVFTAGTYTLDTHNLPILTKIASWKYGFDSPYKGDIYYVSLKQFTDVKWGTTNPIMMRDKDFGVIRLRGFGAFSFRVTDPSTFMREYFGTLHLMQVGQIQEYLKKIILSTLSDLLGECQIPALDLAGEYNELGETTKSHAQTKFNALGLSVTSVLIENLSLPPEVEKSLDTRTTLGVLGDSMDKYSQYQAATALREAANNPSGGFAGAGVGIGAGMALGGVFAKSLADSGAPSTTVKCTTCGKEMAKGLKFCPECGSKAASAPVANDTIKCNACGAMVKSTAKFCPECGEGMSYNCIKCGAVLKGKQKFCPECGTKIE